MGATAITRKQIIEDEAMVWGEKYVKMLEPVVSKQNEFVQTILALNEANKLLRGSANDKEYYNNLKKTNDLGDKAISVWKEQNALEVQLISTKKKNELATEGTNRALVKERVALAETNKELKLQARENLGLVSSYEKLNRQRLQSQKVLGDLLSAEKQNIKEIARAKIEFEQLDARVKAVDAAIKNYSKNIGNYGSAFEGLNGTARNLMSTFGLVSGVALFGTIIKDIFSVVKDFDRQLIAVGKTTNMSKEELKGFGKEVVDLGGKLEGVSIEGLLQSAEVAGQLGVTGTANILKFSNAIEDLKLTSNIISDEQVGQFAKFIEVSSDSFDNADRLASVITRLGNEMATTEAEVLANATEIQKGVAVWNTAASSVLGLGAATSTLGSEAEASRSAIQTTFSVIDKAIASGVGLEKILKLTGLTQKDLSKQFNQDATGVFVKFIGGLSKAKAEGENLNNILTEVDITEKRAFTVIGALAANYGVLQSAMATAADEYKLNAALSKEVAAASESVSSILTDIKDKWQEYILNTNAANGGTERLVVVLKYLRDNLQSIISNIIKYGSVLLVFLGVQKAVNLVTSIATALKVAGTAAQIRFALATGIGTEKILAQAAAARAAMVAQQGLNVAVAATPWGIILAFLSAAVAAYMIFNDEMSKNELQIKKIADLNQQLAKDEKTYADDRDKNRNKDFAAIEAEIKLRRAKGEDSDKLDKEEIARKKEIVQAQIKVYNDLKKAELDRTKVEIDASRQRIIQMEIEKNAGSTTGRRRDELIDLIDVEREKMNLKKAALSADSKLTIEEQKRLQKILDDLDKDAAVKDAAAKLEEDKKAKALRLKKLKDAFELNKKLAEDEYKLRQFRTQVALDAEKEISDNEKASFDDRLDSLLNFQQIYEAKQRDTLERDLKNLGKYNEEKGVFIRQLSDLQIAETLRTGKLTDKASNEAKLIFETYQNNLTNAAKKGISDREKLVDNQVALIQKQIDSENQKANIELNQALKAENDKFLALNAAEKQNQKEREDAIQEHERKILEIKTIYAKKAIQITIDSLRAELDANEKRPEAERISAEKIQQIRDQLAAAEVDLGNISVENYKKNADSKISIEQYLSQAIKDLQSGLTAELVNFANALFNAKIANIDYEIQKSDAYYAAEIEKAGDNQRKKDILQKEAEKKRQELEKKKRVEQYKQAVFNKAVTIAEIGLKTALAIITAAAATAPTFWGVAIASTIGALQLATAIATPLPKYKGGRKGGKEEFAVVGDGGVPEVITDPDGENPRLTPSKPTVTYLGKDDIVHKSLDDYKKYLKLTVLNEFPKQVNTVNEYQKKIAEKRYDREILEEMKRNTRAIEKGKPIIHQSQPIDIPHAIWAAKNINWR